MRKDRAIVISENEVKRLRAEVRRLKRWLRRFLATCVTCTIANVDQWELEAALAGKPAPRKGRGK